MIYLHYLAIAVGYSVLWLASALVVAILLGKAIKMMRGD